MAWEAGSMSWWVLIIDVLRREAVYLWYYFSVQLEQIFKYWVLGMVLGSLVSVFLKDRIHSAFRFMGEKRLGILGIVIASALGIASPLCMYGTIPIAASFSKSGMRDDWLAAFMMSSNLLFRFLKNLARNVRATGWYFPL